MALYAAFAERWAADPQAVAIEEEARVWTRGDLETLAARVATALRQAGAERGRPVCLIAEKSVQAFGVYLACQRAGYPFFPVNAGYTDAEIDYLIGDARPAVVIVDPTRVEGLKPLADRAGAHLLTLAADGGGTVMEAASQIADVDPPAQCSDDDWGALLYTSGTTGKPKGAVLTQGNLLSNARSLVDIWRFTDKDVLLHVLPIFHVHGLFVAGNTSMLSGTRLVWRTAFDPVDVLARLPTATAFMGVPTLYTRLLGQPGLDRSTVANIRLFVSGSAPLDPATFEAFEARTGHRILERYGMTETGMICSNPYEGERLAGTVGYPLPGISVRVGGGPGDVGVVQVKGPNVLREYLNAPEKTAEAFTPDGYFITGDLGVMSEDGRLSLVGRQSDMIISGGYNVYPSEVENVLTTHEGVLEAAVFGVKHPDWGEAVVACVAPRPGVPLDEAVLTELCRAELAAYKRPKRIIIQDSLPRNAMGKTDRKVLRTQHADAFGS
jgi:malonyl-CoA/methylmalonyl-CoA synthetase